MIEWIEKIPFDDKVELLEKEKNLPLTCKQISISGDNVANYQCYDFFNASDDINQVQEKIESKYNDIDDFDVYLFKKVIHEEVY